MHRILSFMASLLLVQGYLTQDDIDYLVRRNTILKIRQQMVSSQLAANLEARGDKVEDQLLYHSRRDDIDDLDDVLQLFLARDETRFNRLLRRTPPADNAKHTPTDTPWAKSNYQVKAEGGPSGSSWTDHGSILKQVKMEVYETDRPPLPPTPGSQVPVPPIREPPPPPAQVPPPPLREPPPPPPPPTTNQKLPTNQQLPTRPPRSPPLGPPPPTRPPPPPPSSGRH